MNSNIPENVDSYISGFPPEIQKKLKQIRTLIKKTAKGAEENISYGMPAYKYNRKVLVYFAAHKSHIGFYATPTASEKFKKELSVYKTGKGSIQFPLDEPLPIDLIKRIVEFRIRANSF